MAVRSLVLNLMDPLGIAVMCSFERLFYKYIARILEKKNSRSIWRVCGHWRRSLWKSSMPNAHCMYKLLFWCYIIGYDKHRLSPKTPKLHRIRAYIHQRVKRRKREKAHELGKTWAGMNRNVHERCTGWHPENKYKVIGKVGASPCLP